VSWVGDVIAGVQERLNAELTAAEEALATAERTRAELRQREAEAVAALTQRQEAVKAKEAELASRSEVVQTAKIQLSEAKEAQRIGDASLVETRKDKEVLDAALEGNVRPLKEADAFKAEDAEGHVSALMPLAKKLGLEDSLLMALPSACTCPPVRRGSFDSMVIDQLEESLKKRVAGLVDILDGGAGAAGEREAAVAAAQQALDRANGVQQAAAAELAEAQAEQLRGAEALMAAEAAQGAQASELGAAAEARDGKAAELQNFGGYNLECFNALRDKAAPAGKGGA